MYGSKLRHGDSLGLVPPPRDLDNYPLDIVTDFRRLETSTLRRYLHHFKLGQVSQGLYSSGELACRVAKHFASFPVEEEDTLGFFVEYTMAYGGGNTTEDVKQRQAVVRRLRKRTRRLGDSSDEEEDGGNGDVGLPVMQLGSSQRQLLHQGGQQSSSSSRQRVRTSGTVEEKVYCTCKRPSFGQMVACDDESCEIEWFHTGCVGIKENELGQGTWFCPVCTERRRVNGEGVSSSGANRRLLDSSPVPGEANSGNSGTRELTEIKERPQRRRRR